VALALAFHEIRRGTPAFATDAGRQCVWLVDPRSPKPEEVV
jgi:hypothetical protein